MKYAFLTYDFPDKPNIHNTGNMMQSLAAAAFLPRIDYIVPYLDIDGHEPNERTKIILNGYWFPHYYTDDRGEYLTSQVFRKWESLEPLLISMHLDNSIMRDGIAYRVREEAAELMRAYGPVGTRDESSRLVLEKNNIPAYKSLCLTLTLQRRKGIVQHDRLVLVDVSDVLAEKFRKESCDEVLDITHLLKQYWNMMEYPGGAGEIMIAEYIFDLLQGARLVVTSRLHMALPSLALGTPVLFVPDSGENGSGNGDMNTNSRLSDYTGLLNVAYTEQILSGQYRLDVNNPPENPKAHIPYREKLIQKARDFIGEECPYDPEGFRVSVFDKMRGLFSDDDLLNIRNNVFTLSTVHFNRYRYRFMNKRSVRLLRRLGLCREPVRYYLGEVK